MNAGLNSRNALSPLERSFDDKQSWINHTYSPRGNSAETLPQFGNMTQSSYGDSPLMRAD